jgi:hypothetical protein
MTDSPWSGYGQPSFGSTGGGRPSVGTPAPGVGTPAPGVGTPAPGAYYTGPA